VLDRKNQRISGFYPAIDIFLSERAAEERCCTTVGAGENPFIRRVWPDTAEEAIQRLLMFVKKFPTTRRWLKGIPG